MKVRARNKVIASMLIMMMIFMQMTNVGIDVLAEENTPKIVVDNVASAPGEQVVVNIALENNPGIASMRLNVSFDESKLSLTKVTDTNLISGKLHKETGGSSPYTLAWSNPTLTENITANGTIVTLTFDVLEGATLGAAPISVSYNYANSDIMDVDFTKINFGIQNGSVMIEKELTGEQAITGLTTPTKNATPINSLTTPNGINAVVKWFDGADEISGKFLGGKAYTAKVEISLEEGYSWGNDVSFTMDGNVIVPIKDGEKYKYENIFNETEERIIESINITNPPTKTEYIHGDNFATTGMVVTATYDDMTQQVLDDNLYEIVAGQDLEKGTTEITIRVKSDTNITASQAITVGKADVVLSFNDEEVRFGNVSTQYLSLSDEVPADAGDVSYEVGTVMDSNEILELSPSVTGGILSYKLKVSGKSDIGKNAIIPVKIVMDNYNDVTVNVRVEIIDKINVDNEIVFENGGDVYTGEPLLYENATYTGLGDGNISYAYEAVTGTLNAEGKPLSKGTYTVTATYQDEDREGKKVVTFSILPKILSGGATIELSGDRTYTGSSITQNVVVKDGEKILTASDYDVSYDNNINVGQATVTVDFKGNYSGKSTENFTIVPKNITSTISVDSIEDKGFSGSKIEPIVVVKDGGSVLTKDVDYTVSYGENINAGINAGTITIKAIGNYTLDADKLVEFNITKAPQTDKVASKNVRYTNVMEQVIDLSSYIPTNAGDVSSIDVAITSDNENLIASVNSNVDDETAMFTLNNGLPVEKVGKTAEITATITTVNYEVFDVVISTELMAKEVQTIELESIGDKVFGDTPFELMATGGSGDGDITFISSAPDIISIEGTTATIKKVGTVTITATKEACDIYGEATDVETITITSKPLSNPNVGITGSKIYTGSQLMPSIEVMDGSTTLVLNKDYTVTYGENINAGLKKGSITVEFIGNYSGNVTKEFDIEAMSIEPVVSDINPQTYTGSQLTPAFTVKYGEDELVLNTDFTFSYGENINAGADAGSVSITLMGNYKGDKEVNFDIDPKDFSSSDIVVGEISDVVYDGMVQTPTVTVADGSTTLKLGKDYTVTYDDNIDASEIAPKANIQGIGNYEGILVKNFKITKKPITVTITSNGREYDGTRNATVTYKVNNVASRDDVTATGTATYDSKNAGSRTITATGIVLQGDGADNYKANIEATCSATISPKNIIPTVENILPVEYTGSQLKPTVVVKDGMIELELGKDYTVVYGKNIDAGVNSGSVEIKLKGNYSGEKKAEFDISKSTYNLGKIATSSAVVKDTETVKVDLSTWKNLKGAKLGTPTTSDSIFKAGMLVTGSTLEYTILESASIGDSGTIIVPVSSTNYNDFDVRVEVTVVDKLTPVIDVKDIVKTYDGKEITYKDIKGIAKYDGKEIEGTWSFEGGTTIKNVADSRNVKVVFTPQNKNRYSVETKTISVEVKKKTAVIGVDLNKDSIYTDEALPTPSISYKGVVSGESLKPTTAGVFSGMPANSRTAGDYKVTWANMGSMKVEIEALPEEDNYNVKYVDEITFEIIPASERVIATTEEDSPFIIRPSVQDEPTEVVVTLIAEMLEKTAHLEIGDSIIGDAIEDAEKYAEEDGTEANGILVEVEMDSENAEDISIELPIGTLDKLTDASVKKLRIKSEVINITFDINALEEIQEKAGNGVHLQVREVYDTELSEEAKKHIGNRPVYEIILVNDEGERISDFGLGTVEIGIPYTLESNEKAENIVAFYIAEDGTFSQMKGKGYNSINKEVLFETDHFSRFAVGYLESEASDEGNNMLMYIVIGLIVIIALAAGGFVLYRRRT